MISKRFSKPKQHFHGFEVNVTQFMKYQYFLPQLDHRIELPESRIHPHRQECYEELYYPIHQTLDQPVLQKHANFYLIGKQTAHLL